MSDEEKDKSVSPLSREETPGSGKEAAVTPTPEAEGKLPLTGTPVAPSEASVSVVPSPSGLDPAAPKEEGDAPTPSPPSEGEAPSGPPPSQPPTGTAQEMQAPESPPEERGAPTLTPSSEGEAPSGPPPSQPPTGTAQETQAPESPEEERGESATKGSEATPPWEAYDFSVQVKQMRLDELTALLRRYEEVIPEAPRNEIEREIARRIVAEGESAGEEERAKLKRQSGPSSTLQFLLLIGAAILFILFLFFVRTLVQRKTAYLLRGNTTQSGAFSPAPSSQGRGNRFSFQRASDVTKGRGSERDRVPGRSGGSSPSPHPPHDGARR
ncbi:MAG: hypothetical protein D6812_12325 [Deltaproteobacteria bacterium]|nr:MAG: hypothetical protein D6812_12325 [Deltaproteobacteria bacterium]